MTSGPMAPSAPRPPGPGATGRVVAWFTSPRARTWLLYVPLCVVTSVMAISTWDVRVHGPSVTDQVSGRAALLWFVGLAAAAALAWRRTYPVGVAALTAVVALVLPLDPTPALIAFGSLMVRRLDRTTGYVGALTLLATWVATWRDGQGSSRATSFWSFIANGNGDLHAVHEPLSWWAILMIASMCFAVTVALALLLRDRTERRQRVLVEETQRTVVATLSDELARQAERERLAQEVHDALGHRLSLLSLHAGALEVARIDDPRAAESAALVRANAQQSMADLRHLLAMLRQPDAPDVAAAVPTLDRVGELIEETLATGTTLVSTVQLEAVAGLDETTSRSAFRITQELLTNARRHAPGIGVRVRVVAAPAVGVEIEIANHVASGAAVPVGADGLVARPEPGGGLRGIAARVEQLHGQWRCWVDDSGVFRAAARLPWVWSTQRSVDGHRRADSAGAGTPDGHLHTQPGVVGEEPRWRGTGDLTEEKR